MPDLWWHQSLTCQSTSTITMSTAIKWSQLISRAFYCIWSRNPLEYLWNCSGLQSDSCVHRLTSWRPGAWRDHLPWITSGSLKRKHTNKNVSKTSRKKSLTLLFLLLLDNTHRSHGQKRSAWNHEHSADTELFYRRLLQNKLHGCCKLFHWHRRPSELTKAMHLKSAQTG